MKRKAVLFVLPILLLVVLMGILIKKKHRELAQMKKPKEFYPVVKVISVTQGNLNLYVKYLGEVVPMVETKIGSKVSGFIEKIFVDDGMVVKKGDLLVQIDERDIKAEIQSIEAKIRAAQSNLEATLAKIPGLKSTVNTNKNIFERDKILHKNKAISQEELDISRKNFEFALSELKATEKTISALKENIKSLESQKAAEKVLLSYTKIRAPFDGIVQKRFLSEGDIVSPGKVILSLIGTKEGAKVTIPIAPEDFLYIKPGSPVHLIFNGKSINARVNTIYPATTSNSLGICNIFMKTPPFNLPYHAKIKAEIITGTVKGLLAPISCLLRSGSKNFVLKVDKSKIVHKIPIQVLGKTEEQICFPKGAIQAGDLLISGRESFLARISSGQKVEIIGKRQGI